MKGRPTDYNQEIQDKAEWYVNGGYSEVGDYVPTVAGLACELDIARDTCYRWGSDEGKPAFSYILTRIRQLQERKLVNGGLGGDFNPAVTKMMLTKHGYSDKQDLSHTSPDGSMSAPSRIELVAPDDDSED